MLNTRRYNMYLKIKFNPMILSLFQIWQMPFKDVFKLKMSYVEQTVCPLNAFWCVICVFLKFLFLFLCRSCVHSTFSEIIQMDMIKLEPGVFCLCVKTETETNGFFLCKSERKSFERIKQKFVVWLGNIWELFNFNFL